MKNRAVLMRKAGLLFLMLLALYSGAAASDLEMLLLEASQLRKEHKDHEALAVYEKVLLLAPQQFEALCQASLLHTRLGSFTNDETTKSQHYKTAETYARKALFNEPESPEANFAIASSSLHLCQIAPVRQKLILLKEAKRHLDLVLEKNLLHSGAWHMLGRWHFRAANYNLSELILTSVLMRDVSKEASNEEAISALQMAVALDPNNILYYHDLARVLQENKQTGECENVLRKALLINLVTAEDLQISRKCKAMLRELKVSSS
jgi:regulator of microtubule dynamics protein 3